MTSETLEHLLRLQDEARAEREQLVEARDSFFESSDEPHLSSEESVQVRALTDAIAEVDAEILLRDERITALTRPASDA